MKRLLPILGVSVLLLSSCSGIVRGGKHGVKKIGKLLKPAAKKVNPPPSPVYDPYEELRSAREKAQEFVLDQTDPGDAVDLYNQLKEDED